MRRVLGILLVLTALSAVPGSALARDGAGSTAAATTPSAVVVAAGDIACPPGYPVTSSQCRQAATAKIAIAQNPVRVLGLGDLQYQKGGYSDFVNSYAKSWGKLKSVTYPIPGNHEYMTSGAAGYYRYFQYRQPGAPGYYRRVVNGWQLYMLNSNCTAIDCAAQRTWLEKQLTAHPSRCALIATHHPRFSSGGEHGSQTFVKPFWTIAYRHHVDIALAGHDHDYERFAPMNPSGQLSSTGIQEFVSGAGGRSHYGKGATVPGSQRFINTAFGVLKLTLLPTSYRWSFIDTAGKVRDSGSASCR